MTTYEVNEASRLRRAKKRGDRVRALKDHELIDLAGAENMPYERDIAIAELQRRGAERLNKSVDRFSQASNQQADVMIRHTKKISWLTVAILVLTVVLAVVQVVGCLAQP